MDPQQRSIFIQKLQRDREAQLRAQQQQKLMAQRQQMMAQQSQQQQMSGQFGAPAGKYFLHFLGTEKYLSPVNLHIYSQQLIQLRTHFRVYS